ncbi:MAG: tetratricopeptide repeat protein [Bacteroidota bacterium]
MHLLKYIFIVSGLSLMLACSDSDTDVQKAKASTKLEAQSVVLPELLQRPEAIQNGKEWETVQNYYGKNKKILASDSEDLMARLELAQLFVQEARITGEHGYYYPAALKMTDDILDRNPTDQNVKFMTLATRAGVELSQHEFEDALKTAQAAVQLNPYNAQIYGALVDAYVELGDYGKAVEMADKMVSIRPDLRSYSRVSYLREIHGEVEGAIEAMQMAVEAGAPGVEPTAWARLTLGDLYKNYGDLEKAEQQYQIILNERPDYPFAIAALADVEMEKGNYEKAETLLNEAKTIIPEVGFYEQLAHLYKKTNREAEMQAMIDEIFPMLEDDVVHGHNMNLEYAAIYKDLLEDHDKALEYVKKEYKKRPDNIDVNQLMAAILVKQDKLAMARPYVDQAGTTNSKNPELMELQQMMRSQL